MAAEQTINAATGQVEPESVRPQPMVARPPQYTIPSIINIPPQIAVTVFWVALGFGLCWWLMGKRSRSIFE